MDFFKKGGRGRKLLPLALIVLPWFLKDHLAAVLEEQSREAQQVLIEEGNQEQREQQSRDIRELNHKLVEIGLNQKVGSLTPKALQEEEAEAMAGIIQAEGQALVRGGKTLLKLLPKVDMEEELRKGLVESAQAAQEVGKAMVAFDPKAAGGSDALGNLWIATEARLTKAYVDLADLAEKDREASSTAATLARFLAWIFTAVGAAMIGGWKQLIGGGRAEEDGDGASEPA